MKKQFTLRHSVFSVFFLGSLFSASHAFAQQDDGEITIEEDEDEEEVVIEDTQAEENSDKDSASLEDSTSDEAASNEPEASEEPASEEAPAPVQARPSKQESTKQSEPSPELEPEVSSTKTSIEDEQLIEQAAQAALVDAPKNEVSLSPLTFSTSTFSRFEYREGYDKLGVSRGRTQEGDMVVFRARLGMQTNPLPIADGSDVYVQFTPQASGVWGTNGTVGEANLGIYEGYVKFRSHRLDVQVGRIMMDYGDALVIGNVDWNQAGRAFDGVRARYKMDKGYLDVFGTQVTAGTTNAGAKLFAGDDLFWGAYAGVGHYLSPTLDLDAYFLGFSNFAQEGLVDETTGAEYRLDGAHLFTAGLRAKQKLRFFDYRLEGGLQFGQSVAAPPPGFSGDEVSAVAHLAFQVDGEIGFALSSRTRLSLGGALASGNDPSTEKNEGWNELYPTGHKFLGLTDIIGARTNVGSGNLKVSQELTKSLKAQADAHVFARLEDGSNEAGFAGTEVDLQLMQGLGKYAQVRGLYGLFIPASGHYPSDDLAHYLEIQAGVTF